MAVLILWITCSALFFATNAWPMVGQSSGDQTMGQNGMMMGGGDTIAVPEALTNPIPSIMAGDDPNQFGAQSSMQNAAAAQSMNGGGFGGQPPPSFSINPGRMFPMGIGGGNGINEQGGMPFAAPPPFLPRDQQMQYPPPPSLRGQFPPPLHPSSYPLPSQPPAAGLGGAPEAMMFHRVHKRWDSAMEPEKGAASITVQYNVTYAFLPTGGGWQVLDVTPANATYFPASAGRVAQMPDADDADSVDEETQASPSTDKRGDASMTNPWMWPVKTGADVDGRLKAPGQGPPGVQPFKFTTNKKF